MRALTIIGILSFAFVTNLLAVDDYKPGPDSKAQEGLPKGEVTKYIFDHSKIFPGTTRDYWIYVPRQYDPATPACYMVFQDGIQYSAPVVFDNLIAKKEIPVMIGIFVMHGRVKALTTNALDRFNRSYEYDGMGDNYVRFLTEELIPEVAKKYNLSTNANDHAIAGASSGAIAAFTAAWERPESFRRVFSSIGTYVGLRGGNMYPTLIRKTEPKPIRIFLQDGTGDLNIYGGNWHLANEEMLSALEFGGYEVDHIWGDGAHNSKQATAIFPDALRWLWKDYPKPVTAGHGEHHPASEFLIPGEDWQVVGSDYKFADGPIANTAGEIFFTDRLNKRIYKVGLDGKVSPFIDGKPGCGGLMFGPGGNLFGCQVETKRIVSYDPDAKETVIADGIEGNDLAVTYGNEVYVTDTRGKKVWFIDANRQKRVVDEGIAAPNGIRLTPDQSLLLVSDTRGQFVYSFQILPDGSLTNKQRYFYLHMVDGSTQSAGDGMAVDTTGQLYVTTEMGLQICDQAGRVHCILPKPKRGPLSAVAFGGANMDELYITCGDTLYKRKVKTRGVKSFELPIKPAAPHL